MDQHLGEHISQVGGLPLLSYPGYYGSHIFPERMVANNYDLLLQCRLRVQHVLIDRFIVAEYVGWYLYRDTKHLQLLPKGFDQFSRCLESNELN